MHRKPIALFAGSFGLGSSEAGLTAGFHELGWGVQQIDLRDFKFKPGEGNVSRILARFVNEFAIQRYQQKIVDEVKSLNPDIFITVKGAHISLRVLQEIKSQGIYNVMYYPDYHFDYPDVSVDSFSGYDFFVTTKGFQVEYLEKIIGRDRVAHVPHGYSPSVHQPVYSRMIESEFEADVLYSGSHTPYKQRWIESAIAALSSNKFRIVGKGWRDKLAHELIPRSQVQGPIFGVGYAAAIQSARINLAVHMGPSASGWEDLVSTRTFEIPACGGFMLHIDNELVRQYFEPGVEIDVFNSPDELAEKARFYLKNPAVREKMIERAHARCVPTYSYLERAIEIAKLIDQRIGWEEK